MPITVPRVTLVLLAIAIASGCVPGQADADRPGPAVVAAGEPAGEPVAALEPAAKPEPSSVVDLTIVPVIRARIVAIPNRKSWVPCGVKHSVGALEVEVLDAGEPAPRMVLLVSCPAGVRSQKLEVGATITVTLHRRRQPWPPVQGLPKDLPRRYVASIEPGRSDEVSAAEVVPPPTLEPSAPEPALREPIPWGSPLRATGNSRGLRWTSTAQIERTTTGLRLALDVGFHNATQAPMEVSLHPPNATVMVTTAPGWDGEGRLGFRGEGMGSDVCSPGHGGPTTLSPGERRSVHHTIELDPLPWPPGQALRVAASSRDCRPDRLDLDVLDVLVLPPSAPDREASLRAVSE